MTIIESSTAKGWYSVAKFSELDVLDDNHFNFLRAIIDFNNIPREEIPEAGYLMPDLVMKRQVIRRIPGIDMQYTEVQHTRLSLGRVTGIDFEPFSEDRTPTGSIYDGLIFIKPAVSSGPPTAIPG